MYSPEAAVTSGWMGAVGGSRNGHEMEPPRTVERRRKGRGVDVIGSLPTPPPTHHKHHSRNALPTPETVRLPRKSQSSRHQDKMFFESPETVLHGGVEGLPTPQTLPRKRAVHDDGVHVRPDSLSPGGETTFTHLNIDNDLVGPDYAVTSSTKRRRPGLTFAQQMGLLTGPSGTGNAHRQGAGVGMGGHRSAAHAVDRIVLGGKLDLRGDRETAEEENPFLDTASRGGKSKGSLTLASPGMLVDRLAPPRRMSMAVEDEEEDDEEEEDHAASPLQDRSPAFDTTMFGLRKSSTARKLFGGGPSNNTSTNPVTPTKASTSRAAPHTPLAPPPAFAQPTTPTRSSPRLTARAARDAESQARLIAMRDEDHNPFLAKPGEIVRPRLASSGMGVTDDAHAPFVTYVFRGSKRVFANPFVPADARFPASELDPEDEDYDEHPCPKPRLLWPTPLTEVEKAEAAAAAARAGQNVDHGMDRMEQIEVTPSPPSSPMVPTPQTRPRVRAGASASRPSQEYRRNEGGNGKGRVGAGNGHGARPEVRVVADDEDPFGHDESLHDPVERVGAGRSGKRQAAVRNVAGGGASKRAKVTRL